MLGYLAVLVLAAAAGHVLYVVSAWIAQGEPPRQVCDLVARLRPPPAPAEPMPAVLHELELARLTAVLQQVRESDAQGRATRVRAVTIAYDDALVRCCHSYGIDPPAGRRPLSAEQRLVTESELLAAGASW